MELEKINKPGSAWIATHINGKLSLFLVQRLIKTSITPNQITTFSLLVGLVAALLISQVQSHLCVAIAGLLWQCFAILDHTDGAIARVKHLQSKFGAWFDTIVGHLTYLAFFTGLILGMYRVSKNMLYPLIGFSSMALLLIALIPSYLWMKKSGQASLETYNNTFAMVSERKRQNPIFRAMNRVKYFAKGQFSRLLFCLLALMNQTQLIFWLIVIGACLIAAGIFLSIGDRLRLASASSHAIQSS